VSGTHWTKTPSLGTLYVYENNLLIRIINNISVPSHLVRREQDKLRVSEFCTPEDGDSTPFRNAAICLRVQTALQPRRTSSPSAPWEPQIALYAVNSSPVVSYFTARIGHGMSEAVPLRLASSKGKRKYSSYSLLTSALDRCEWSVSRPGRALPPRKGSPVPIG
jgi:hypothetical protein